MPKVYCKYCHSYVGLEIQDDLYVCNNCGAGLVPVSVLKTHGSYKRYLECINIAFAVMNEAYEWNHSKGNMIKEDSVYPKCPHEQKENRKLYSVALIIAMRRSVGLPDKPFLPQIKEES